MPPPQTSFDDGEHELPGPNEGSDLAPSSLKDHVHIDFDLELPSIDEAAPSPQSAEPATQAALNPQPIEGENPLQVRFDLAQELWQVGQHHTARAIADEVASQASGELKEQIQAWLTQRQ